MSPGEGLATAEGRREPMQLANRARTGHLVSVALFGGFFLLYFALGSILATLDAVYDYFGADMWVDLDPNAEYRHMLVPIFVEPVVRVVRRLFASVPAQAAALNAAFGALAVALAFQVFLRVVRSSREATLLALLYGVSMSQMLFSSVPETYAIGASGIVATYLVFLVSLATGRLRFLPWFGVALWTVGITTSNVAQTAVAYVAAARRAPGQRRVLRGALLGVAVLASVILFLRFQPGIVGSRPLLSLEALQTEYIDIVSNVVPPPDPEDEGPPDPPLSEGRSVRLLATNYLLLGFVGGVPGRSPLDDHRTKLEYFGHPLRFTPLGLVAAVLWIVLWLAGVRANLRAARARDAWPPRTFLGATGLIVAGNLLLFTIYNPIEMYLYSLLTTFPILLLGVNGEMLRKPRWAAALAVLVVLMGLNNFDIIGTMLDCGACQ